MKTFNYTDPAMANLLVAAFAQMEVLNRCSHELQELTGIPALEVQERLSYCVDGVSITEFAADPVAAFRAFDENEKARQ